MIPSAIFALIFIVSIFAFRGKRSVTVILHLLALVVVAALFAHHVTEPLDLSF